MKRMKNLLWCFILVATPVHAGSVQPSQFRHTIDIRDDFRPDAPARLTLTERVISKTSQAFSDLRIFDDRGHEVPYVIYEEIVPGERETNFDFTLRSFDSAQDQVTVVVERPGKDEPYDRIEILTSARDFKKNVRVYSSTSSGEELPEIWKQLSDDTVFDFSSRIDLRKKKFEIDSTSSRYLKIVFTDERPAGEEEESIRLEYDGLKFEVGGLKDEPFRIDRIRGWRGEKRAGEAVLDRKIISQPGQIIDDNGDSIHNLGPVNLPVSQITLRVDRKYYHRRVELLGASSDNDEEYTSIGSGTIYNIPGMDDPSATFSVAARDHRYLKLRIVNRDNPPLDVLKLELAWPRNNLYFIPEKGRSYSLFFGGDDILRPDYELGQIIKGEHGILSSFPGLALENIRKNSGYEAGKPKPTKEITERAAFKIVILVLVLGLAWWLYSLMKKLPRSDV